MKVPELNIAIVPGDGIGPEVCACAVEIMEAAAGSASFKFDYYEGGADTYLKVGTALPDATLEACRSAHAILHGAAGLPNVTYPDGTEAGQDFSMKMRSALDLYANIRPVRRYDSASGGSGNKELKPIDYVIVRENTEGLYAARSGGNILQDRVATDTLVITRDGVERIVRAAADLAMQRSGAPGDGKRRVTIVDKANVLRSYAFFRKIALEVLEEYPDIEVECILVDAMTTYMVQSPQRLDVVVTENMFGDILSDLGAATIGGLGLAPSAEIGDRHGYFQGIHGSAPDIANRAIANPIATILSACMLMEWLGQSARDVALAECGDRVRRAVGDYLRTGRDLTPDLGGSATSSVCTAAIKAHLLDPG